MEYTVHQAKTNFSKLLTLAQSGEDVIVTSGQAKTPVARLIPIHGTGAIQLGLFASPGGFKTADEDVLASLYTHEELQAIEGGSL